MKTLVHSSIVLLGLLALNGGCGAAEDLGDPSVESAAGDALPLARGARGPLVRQVHEYLAAFGYFPNRALSEEFPGFRPIVATSPAAPDVFDASTEAAVRKFQANFGLPVDGRLTEQALQLMDGPRCGTPDTDLEAPELTNKWALNTGRWTKTNIQYRFDAPNEALPGLSLAATKDNIRASFAAWEAVTNLSFSEVTSGSDIVIRYTDIGTEGALGVGGAPPGVIFLLENDPSEVNWSATLLKNVAIHEIGHVLGLAHSSIGNGNSQSAVMWPATTGRTTLDEDDIIAANSIYNDWEQLPGGATDVGANTMAGVGVDSDALWKLGDTLFSDGYDAYEWTGVWTLRSGVRGVRIDVDNKGRAWLIGGNGLIYRWNGSSFGEVPGGGIGTDIGIGSNGDVFVIGTDGNAWKLASSGSGWITTGGPGNGVAIDVDRNGVPWVVKSNKQLMSRTAPDGSWLSEGVAVDIGMGGNADVFGDSTAYRWLIDSTTNMPKVENIQPLFQGCGGSCSAPRRDGWVQVNGAATRIAVGRKGRAYIVDGSGKIYRRREMP